MVKLKKRDILENLENLFELNIPFQPAALTELPSKPRTSIIKPEDYIDNMKPRGKHNLVDDMVVDPENDDRLSTEPIAPSSDVDQVKAVLDNTISLFDNDDIKVLFRNKTDLGIMYDVYLKDAHTILYIKPEDFKIYLVNRSLDEDNFRDVLEDVQEMDVEDEDKTVAKKLIIIAKDKMYPEEPDISSAELEEVDDDLNDIVNDEDNVEDDVETDDDSEDNVEDDAEPDDDSEDDSDGDEPEGKGDVGDLNLDEPLDDEPEKSIKKESINNKKLIGDVMNKTVKDVRNDYGYKFITSKDEISAMVEFLGIDNLGKFGSFFVRVDEDAYSDVYGMFGNRPDNNKELITIIENGNTIFNSSTKVKIDESFDVGEVIKIDLSRVDGIYAKQVIGIARKGNMKAIVESVKDGIVYIAQNAIKAKTVGGIPVNAEAIVKINNIKDASSLYEDINMSDNFNSLVENRMGEVVKEKKDKLKKDLNEVDSTIMDASFGVIRDI